MVKPHRAVLTRSDGLRQRRGKPKINIRETSPSAAAPGLPRGVREVPPGEQEPGC